MVLMVQGVVQDEPPPDTRTLYLNHPVLRDSASQLLTISTKVVGPIGLLYVCQREMAVTVPHDSTYTTDSTNDRSLFYFFFFFAKPSLRVRMRRNPFEYNNRCT